jgi:hypothetical protein
MSASPTYERVTVNLIKKASDALTAVSAREGMNKTDAINRALQIYNYLSAGAARGDDILIRDPQTGATERLSWV